MNGNQTLISDGGTFELGFFSPRNSGPVYLGIWFHNIPTRTVVWVANRDSPVNDSSSVALKIGNDGDLVLVDGTERIIWSSGIANITSKDTVVPLLDSGNLVLGDQGSISSSDDYLWQSFDHPTNTLLAGMKLGWDLRVSLDRYLTSWKREDDPSLGDFTYGFELEGLPQKFLRKYNSKVIQRSGPWEGTRFSGLGMSSLSTIRPSFVQTPDEVYYTYNVSNKSTITRTVLSHTGSLQRCLWSDQNLEWSVTYSIPNDACDEYGKCGPNAICTINSPRICSCLTGYIPKSPLDWSALGWSEGCVKKNPSSCPGKEGFRKLKGVKVPDMLQFWINTSMSLKECRDKCLSNCSCSAYSVTDIEGRGSGCLIWYGDLIDMRQLNEFSSNQNVFIRVTASDLGRHVDVHSGDDIELPMLNFVAIAKATDNFSYLNKIGEGGFGPVYRGQLPNGKEIAVKRLSENSRQGSDEFKNEALFIARLQHRNLVKLLGCCIDGEERMLIYEYMPNGSLNSYIFDTLLTGNVTAANSLVWRRRFDIIVGVARGLLYLHRDSRLRIIHRDLKASNVLLDSEMNPKISDFGMARAVGGDQMLEKTMRVVGTYGYMSPENAIDGIFSTKSDVFSFGVLVLEIISGRKNRAFRHPDHNFNLLGHPWKLWLEGKAFELIDEKMEDSFAVSEVMRCIQIGLLCVQRHPEDRPSMASVILMLDSQSAMLPQPKQLGFFDERNHEDVDYSLSNEMTITQIEGR
ncbi:hypothetical protein CDL15_Pgr013020 [Punica granatum]|uniref:Receptor-like serine/threonine-protein kinase n=1 Tax=Punica granatum TaxID=22663 RepID=A0A218XFS5_PUNGR|nr:hypothetical protein CDL15_Pgr013020 [Punica granatum]